MNMRAILGAACMIVVLAGCKQEKGESCQIDDDCASDDLICCKPSPYAIETDRGVCLTREECDTRDASTDPGADPEADGPDDPEDDGDPGEEVTDPAPDPAEDPDTDPAEDPDTDPVTDPETDDAALDETED